MSVHYRRAPHHRALPVRSRCREPATCAGGNRSGGGHGGWWRRAASPRSLCSTGSGAGHYHRLPGRLQRSSSHCALHNFVCAPAVHLARPAAAMLRARKAPPLPSLHLVWSPARQPLATDAFTGARKLTCHCLPCEHHRGILCCSIVNFCLGNNFDLHQPRIESCRRVLATRQHHGPALTPRATASARDNSDDRTRRIFKPFRSPAATGT